ncbi:hypothetical protein Cri9333_4580 [Crinalium epipsammum PCC 9333]|uniref:Uncharacterized protein n=1 Tax=Crinalium epipsammum PCC 9333 TaxID=1173022 RepID=K9W7B5_9CYAN|nr:hypothetical protein [Crinalium epipsammum]AFZ15360.1 hypothetical protein Cri9333_4580 [Crinalium epipsammum PCC 9333]
MSYESIDEMQKVLAEDVFKHTTDRKKAAGRALGTLVELITYYLIREWNLSRYLTIEWRLPEFGNSEITHNVEFALHPLIHSGVHTLKLSRLPLTSPKINNIPEIKELLNDFTPISSTQILTSNNLQRNRALIGRNHANGNLAIIDLLDFSTFEDFDTINSLYNFKAELELSVITPNPFALFECKRVGVEEGAKKGPTTIEKAKQGAYVAKHVSCLQKIRSADGKLFGILPTPNGGFEYELYDVALDKMIYEATPERLKNFILTIGIVSNHGNWFTSDNPNKELLVLKQSYDWLLFLTDHGLTKFIKDLILNPIAQNNAVRQAFLASYDSPRGSGSRNQLTKVKLLRDAHLIISSYLSSNLDEIENEWFNVIAPPKKDIHHLKEHLSLLTQKKLPL